MEVTGLPDECCRGLEGQFDDHEAQARLLDYRRHGPAHSTRLLLDALVREGVGGETVLDIGAGVGAVYLDLLHSGAARAVDVDASAAYLAAARAESERLGFGERVEYRHGDLVELAGGLEPAGIVTLDRVICCYGDMAALVGRSAALATKVYGLVYPRDAWWSRLGVRFANAFLRLRRSAFRIYIHRTADVEGVLGEAGLIRQMSTTAGFWQVAVFSRVRP